MLPSGSTRPDQPIRKASNVPASSFESAVTKSVDCTFILIPTAASSAWRNWASRRATVPVGTIRFTVGFEIPEAFTSALALVGLYGVHLMLLLNHELAGEIAVQSG